MRRSLGSLLTLVLMASPAFAQDGPLRRAGQALDNAGKNIRYRVESEVARGQVAAQERDVLFRVTRRIEWDKQLVGSTLRIEVQPDGAVILRGSVLTDAVKLRAVDLVANTIGVTSVVDELAVVKAVKVIKPTGPVIEVTPPVPSETKVIVPSEPKVIVKP
jgi:hyperosmotically inducible periplasmic protein